MSARVVALVVGAGLIASASAATATAGAVDETMSARARTVARPAECQGGDGFWRSHTLVRGSPCSLLARGYSALRSRPERALELAGRVLLAVPGHASAALLEARARVALRQFDAALVAFARAGIAGPAGSLSAARSLDGAALHDFARALAATGRAGEAAAAYRLLMPRSEEIGDRAGARLSAAVEAALAVMNDSAGGAREAIALLTPHVERSQYRGGESIARIALLLAVDRNGGATSAVKLDGSDLDAVAQDSPRYLPWLTELDRAALVGMAHAEGNTERARSGWIRFLELAAPDHPFRAHAEARLGKPGGGS